MERIRRHLTRNAVAYLALFFALSGSAYAAVKVGSFGWNNGSSMSYLLVGTG